MFDFLVSNNFASAMFDIAIDKISININVARSAHATVVVIFNIKNKTIAIGINISPKIPVPNEPTLNLVPIFSNRFGIFLMTIISNTIVTTKYLAKSRTYPKTMSNADFSDLTCFEKLTFLISASSLIVASFPDA